MNEGLNKDDRPGISLTSENIFTHLKKKCIKQIDEQILSKMFHF